MIMNKRFKSIIYLLSVSCMMFTSCKDDTYDFEGDSENKVYIVPIENTVNGSNRSTINVTVTPVSLQKDKSLALPVASTLPANGDINVSFCVDLSLVEGYNTKHGTSYQALPLKTVDLSNAELKIPARKTNSDGALEISLGEAAAELENGLYLLPIKIDKVEGNAVVSSNRNALYVLVNVYVDPDNIWDNPPAESEIGNQLADDRTGWEVTSINSSFPYGVGQMLDGKLNTNAQYKIDNTTEERSFTVDMKKEYDDVTGVRIHFYNAWYYMKTFDVYTSLDNKNWTKQGRYDRETPLATVAFYKPVKARYIKIEAINYSWAIYIWEFNIYTKNN